MITEKEEIKNLINDGIKTIVMHRINAGGKRAYITTEPFKAYSGLTGALHAATFRGNVDGKRIDKWRDKMVDHIGREGQEAYLSSMADFGTLLHMAALSIKVNGHLDWDAEQKLAYKYFQESAKKNGIEPNDNVIRAQVFEYCKSAASLLQFFADNVVEVYAIEGMAKTEDLQIATPVDIVCRIKDKKGERNVSINIKTSSQISDHQREQCAMEKFMWNETYPDLQVQQTGILRPKDWSMKKGIPTYEFELLDEQTDYDMLTDARQRLRQCMLNPKSTYLTFPETVNVFSGVTKLGEVPKIESKTLEELFYQFKNESE